MEMQRSRHIWEIYRRSNREGLLTCRNKEMQGMKDGVTSSKSQANRGQFFLSQFIPDEKDCCGFKEWTRRQGDYLGVSDGHPGFMMKA